MGVKNLGPKCRHIRASGFVTLVFICILILASNIALYSQEYDPQKIQKLKAELWSILENQGIQPAVTAADLTDDQKKTLASISKVNDYPIYVMTYYGDYGFDEFLKIGHPADTQSEVFREGCSCFSTLNKLGNKIYGRNLDLTNLYPLLVLYTNPPNGYASISLNIGSDIESYLNDPSDEENIKWVLEYPYWTFDGMNEYGVTISGLDVQGEEVFDPDKVSLGRYEIRRLVLDYARNINEAISLIKKFNNLSSSSVHYLVSDAQGNSAVVEYHDGKVNAHRNVEPWQVTTNFMIRGAAPDSILGNCERYDTLYENLRFYEGLISRWTGMNLLSLVSRYQLPTGDGRYIFTVWSAIYDMTRGWLEVCPGTQYDNKERFKLDTINDLAVLSARIKPRRLALGKGFEADVRVKNQSPHPSRKTYVNLYFSKKRKIKEDSVFLGEKILNSLNPYEKKSLSFEGVLNESIDIGPYYFVVVVDEKGKNNDPKQKNNMYVWKKQVVIE